MITNIILIGPPGSGKTVCGQALAQRLGWAFIDTDQHIEKVSGQTIPQIFANHGEPHFRQLETELLMELSTSDGQSHVIASGGGLPVTPGNLELLRQLGPVICLLAGEAVLVDRLDGGKGRPMFAGQSGTYNALLTRLKELMEQRAAVYEAALHRVDTSSLAPQQVADEIVRLLGFTV